MNANNLSDSIKLINENHALVKNAILCDISDETDERDVKVVSTGCENESEIRPPDDIPGNRAKEKPNNQRHFEENNDNEIKNSDTSLSSDVAQKVIEDKPAIRKKHIHPYICNLTKKQWAAVKQFLKKKQLAQKKFKQRVAEIEKEIRVTEKAEADRLRQLEVKKELFGDEYEFVDKKRKRKKRSARRVSMVSLGVKQVINWRKPPKIEVHYNKTWGVRAHNTTYYQSPMISLPEIRPVQMHYEGPEIPVRATKTLELRITYIKTHADYLKQEDYIKYPKRPPFIVIQT
ncbi:hypothetical protein PGB90_000441 [Kerria lacca]